MAKDLQVDDYGNLVIDPATHDFVIIDGLDEIAQRIRATLLIRYGEMVNLDPEQGMDYSDFIGKNFNESLASNDMSTTIKEQVPEVQTVNRITFKKAPYRKLYVNFDCTVSVNDGDTENLKGGVELGD